METPRSSRRELVYSRSQKNMLTEVIGPFSDLSSRKGLLVRFHEKPIAVSFLRYEASAVFEGDIILGSSEEVERLYRENAEDLADIDSPVGSAEAKAVNAAARIALGKIDPRWPGGKVPFIVDPALRSLERVRHAIEQWEMNTHVRFVPHRNEPDYIRLERASGCASSIGRQGGYQPVYVSDDATAGNIMHELGHVLGLWHEHSRNDRDEYIIIDHSNIPHALALNFDQKVADGDDIGGYDFDSIMHYHDRAFARDPARPTIIVPSGHIIGQRMHLSRGDIAAVKSLYPV
jgi:hypothetical protein